MESKEYFEKLIADETAVELAKMRAELMRAECEKAELLLKYNALKNAVSAI